MAARWDQPGNLSQILMPGSQLHMFWFNLYGVRPGLWDDFEADSDVQPSLRASDLCWDPKDESEWAT